MGWRDGQGGGAMQPQSSLSGFRGGANPLAGTGGVRSPSGPYGPPGFLGGGPGGPGGMYAGGPGGTYTGAVSTGGAEPFPTGSSTTGGVGTTMQPNSESGMVHVLGGTGRYGPPELGIMDPNDPRLSQPNAGATNGPRLPPIPANLPGGMASGYGSLFGAQGPMLPNNPDWFASPQGLAQQAAMAQRLTRGMGPGTLGQTHAPVVPGSGPTQGYVSPNAAMRGMGGAERSAYIEAQRAGQPRTWYAKELAAAGIPWQGMSDFAQMQAWLNTLPPDQRQSYIAAAQAQGIDYSSTPTAGTPGNPFGN